MTRAATPAIHARRTRFSARCVFAARAIEWAGASAGPCRASVAARAALRSSTSLDRDLSRVRFAFSREAPASAKSRPVSASRRPPDSRERLTNSSIETSLNRSRIDRRTRRTDRNASLPVDRTESGKRSLRQCSRRKCAAWAKTTPQRKIFADDARRLDAKRHKLEGIRAFDPSCAWLSRLTPKATGAMWRDDRRNSRRRFAPWAGAAHPVATFRRLAYITSLGPRPGPKPASR